MSEPFGDRFLEEKIALEVVAEYRRAASRFGSFHSAHEGMAVIREEYLELEKAIFWDDGGPGNARIEAIQLAAMALRMVIDRFPFVGKEATDD